MTSMLRTTLRSALRHSAASTSYASTSKLPLGVRFNTTSSSTASSAESSVSAVSEGSEAQEEAGGPTAVRYSYFVPRVGKTLDSLPVYTDVRNGGTRTMTEVRKIQGSVNDLKSDLEVFLADTYAASNPELINPDSPLRVNKKPLRPKPGRKLIPTTANPSYLQPVAQAKVTSAGKLKIRGNRVSEVRAFLESRGF